MSSFKLSSQWAAPSRKTNCRLYINILAHRNTIIYILPNYTCWHKINRTFEAPIKVFPFKFVRFLLLEPAPICQSALEQRLDCCKVGKLITINGKFFKCCKRGCEQSLKKCLNVDGIQLCQMKLWLCFYCLHFSCILGNQQLEGT